MKASLRVTFKNLAPSAALHARILHKVKTLEHLTPDILGCRVCVEEQHKLFRIHLELILPGATLVVSKDPEREDPYIAVRDTFEALERQLDTYLRRRRGEVKTHAA